MLYGLKQGKTEKKIIETCYKERIRLPDAILNAPTLNIGLEIFYAAFLDLGTSRGGMGDGAIPWYEVERYARLNEFSDDQKEDLHYHIAALDEAFMEYQRQNGK